MSPRPCLRQRRYSPAAFVAPAAGLEHLDRHPLADPDTPGLRGAVSDRLYDPHRLVPRDERQPAGQHTGELLVIGAAEPACLDPEQGVVPSRRRNGELPPHQAPRSLENQGGSDFRERCQDCRGSSPLGPVFVTSGVLWLSGSWPPCCHGHQTGHQGVPVVTALRLNEAVTVEPEGAGRPTAVLGGFHPAVATWFARRFTDGPTSARLEAGRSSAAAPTPSSQLLPVRERPWPASSWRSTTHTRAHESGEALEGSTRVVYVSPLKAPTRSTSTRTSSVRWPRSQRWRVRWVSRCRPSQWRSAPGTPPRVHRAPAMVRASDLPRHHAGEPLPPPHRRAQPIGARRRAHRDRGRDPHARPRQAGLAPRTQHVRRG